MELFFPLSFRYVCVCVQEMEGGEGGLVDHFNLWHIVHSELGNALRNSIK